MTGVARLADLSTGHPPCYPPRPNIQGSPNVFVNGRPVHRVGDAYAPHCAPCIKGRPCHGAVLANGSPNVFVNGKQVGRIGDPVSCGCVVMTGSGDSIMN